MISNPFWNGTPKGLTTKFRVGRGLRLDRDKVLSTTQPEHPYTTLSGDISGGGSGNVPVTVGPGAIDNTKLADMDAWTIKLRNDAVAGDPQDAALADLTAEAAPAAGDFLLGFLADGSIVKIDIGDLPAGATYTDENAQDAVGAMVDASLVYVDGTPLLQRAALTGDVTAAAGSNATTLADTAVTPGSYSNAAITVDSKGRLTAAANGAAGPGSWALIDTQNASNSATLDFPFDESLYDELEIIAQSIVNATDAQDLWLRIGTGAGPTYATGASDYSFAKVGVFGTSGGGSPFDAVDTTFGGMQFPMTSISNVAGETSNGFLRVWDMAAGAYCQVAGVGGGWHSGNGHVLAMASGRYNATTAITALRVLAGPTGNITSGKVSLYGRLKAV